jgi:hypothetical protein
MGTSESGSSTSSQCDRCGDTVEHEKMQEHKFWNHRRIHSKDPQATAAGRAAATEAKRRVKAGGSYYE